MSASKTKKQTGPTLKKNVSIIQDDNSHIRRTNNKRNRPMWQLEITIQYLIAEKKPNIFRVSVT